MVLINPEITDFYEQSAEESRLTMGLGPLEFERNKELISRYLPRTKACIADIGGGTGHYARWLSGLGHQVILIDPVSKHIRQAEKRSKRSGNHFSCILAEARKLPIASCSADVVILHGPLYHLQAAEDRILAIKEARRVLKIGGVVLGFAITYAASTLAALQNGLIHDQNIYLMCREELTSGDHHAPESYPGILPASYYHRPSALISEFAAAGFKTIDLLAVEGIAWTDKKYFDSWSSPEKKQRLLDLVRLTEADPELLCLSPHMMLAAEIDLLDI